jgi:hypothetical protein
VEVDLAQLLALLKSSNEDVLEGLLDLGEELQQARRRAAADC